MAHWQTLGIAIAVVTFILLVIEDYVVVILCHTS